MRRCRKLTPEMKKVVWKTPPTSNLGLGWVSNKNWDDGKRAVPQDEDVDKDGNPKELDFDD